ncbi:LysR family transcriptional regulator, partial [Aliiroseovarius sp. KMU-50]
FVEVARAGGFRAAADRLKLAPGSVSEAVQRFEDRLGVRLIVRSTRHIALTRAGEILFRRSLPAVDALENALNDLQTEEGELSGALRLTAPIGAGPLFLDRMILSFAKAHPALSIEVIYDEKKLDLVTSGVDAAIRAEALLDPDSYAIPLGPMREMVIVASPAYLRYAPKLRTPTELTAHPGICFAFGDAGHLAPWVMTGPDGTHSPMPIPRVVVNDVNSIIAHAEAGSGLAYVFKEAVRDHIEAGRLVQVLEDYVAPLPRFTLNYLSKRNMPTRLRAFIDFARAFE